MVRHRFRARIVALLATSMLAGAFVAPAPALGAAAFVVDTLADTIADDGACSLREAITIANAGSGAANGCPSGGGQADITFSVSGTITLTSALPQVTGTITIDGGSKITVDGANAYQVFRISGGTLALRHLTVRHGRGQFGGGITNAGTLYANGITVSDSTATNSGGGIYHSGLLLDVRNSTINANSAPYGAGVYLTQSSLISNSTFHGNTATTAGGGLYADSSVTLTHVTIVANTAPADAGGGIFQASGTEIEKNSLIAGNVGGQAASVGGGGGGSMTTIADSAAGIVDTVLRDNGGPTKTLLLLPTAFLELGNTDVSDCADAPINSLDQRGNFRPGGACDRGAVQRDRVAPGFKYPAVLFTRPDTTLSGTSIRARVAATGQDDAIGMGVDSFTLQRQLDGGAWKTIATLPGGAKGQLADALSNQSLAKDHTYRFRLRAIDQDGNTSPWSYTPTVKARLVQQSSTSVTFSSGWSSTSATRYSGGSERYTTAIGKSVKITFTGRSLTLITTRRANPVTYHVYVDGVDQGYKTLDGGTTTDRVQFPIWFGSSSKTHTVRLVTFMGSRFDVDAFAILK